MRRFVLAPLVTAKDGSLIPDVTENFVVIRSMKGWALCKIAIADDAPVDDRTVADLVPPDKAAVPEVDPDPLSAKEADSMKSLLGTTIGYDTKSYEADVPTDREELLTYIVTDLLGYADTDLPTILSKYDIRG